MRHPVYSQNIISKNFGEHKFIGLTIFPLQILNLRDALHAQKKRAEAMNSEGLYVSVKIQWFRDDLHVQKWAEAMNSEDLYV